MAGKKKKQPEARTRPEESEKVLAKADAEEKSLIKPEAGEVIDQGLEEVPPEMRTVIKAWSAMFSQVSGPFNPLLAKFKDGHIDKYLDNMSRESDHDYELKKGNRWFYLVYAIIAVTVFIAGVVYLLPDNKDLLIQLIVIIVAIAGGIGGGYGLSKRHS